MERIGAETQQNSLRLKGAVSQAEKELLADMRRPDVESLLEPASRLIDDHLFWQSQENGLALFVDRAGMRSYRLPIRFDERVIVEERFHVKPLMAFLASDDEFYVLALSQNEVRLLRGSRWAVSEVDVENAPESLKDALWYKDREPGHQGWASRRGGRLTFHGHGQVDKVPEEDLKNFFRQVDSAAREVIPHQQTPVVLAGVGYLHSLYREVTDLNVLDEGVEGNPDEVPAEELHQRAWPAVKEVFTARREEAAERIGAADTSSSLDDVVMGAAQGRIATLFLPARVQRPGRYDRETMQVSLDDDGVDLYDLAAVETWRHGGEVYIVEPDDMPGEGELAAVFRY